MAKSPNPQPLPRELLSQHGFIETGSERGLLDLLQAAAAFCAGAVSLVLVDRSGVWFQADAGLNAGSDVGPSVGLSADRRDRLEAALARPEGEAGVLIAQLGLALLAECALEDQVGERLGWLRLLGARARPLLPTERAGLDGVAGAMARLVALKGEQAEQRRVPRGPSGASFVPGLVHELRNFSFGLSASLDAFQARFAEQPEALTYGTVMRGSLDRLGAFLEELGDYGNPRLDSWRELPLEPLLREAMLLRGPEAARAQVDLRLQLDDLLPVVRMDEPSLRTALSRLLSLALEQENPGGCVVLRVGTRPRGERQVVFGHLDGTGFKLQGMDLTRLFEPFYFRPSGLGRLGLPVARRIFEVHGGNLSASPGPEGGLRMGFMLPAC